MKRFWGAIVLSIGCAPVAYADMHRAINEVPESEGAKAQLLVDKEKHQAELDRLQNELKAEQAAFEADENMSRGERSARLADMRREFKHLKSRFEQLQQDLYDQEKAWVDALSIPLRKHAAVVAKKHGFDSFVEEEPTFAEAVDITDETIQAYVDSGERVMPEAMADTEGK